MKKLNLISVITVLAALLFSALPGEATVHRVNNNPAYNQSAGCTNCVYTSLSAAVASASTNDTLLIEGSTYNGGYPAVTITKRLVLIGPGYFLSGTGSNPNKQYNGVSTNIAEIFLNSGAAGCVLKGLHVIGYVHVNDSDITINRCRIGDTEIGNNVTAGYQVKNILITQCYLEGFHTGGSGFIYNLSLTNNYLVNTLVLTNNVTASSFINNVFYNGVNPANTNVSFFNNIFANNSTFTGVNNNTTCNVQYNIFSAIPALPVNCTQTNYAVTAANIFVGTGSTDGMRQINSGTCIPCVNGSSTGGEIGMFGGPSPYKLSGVPNVPAIYNLDAGSLILQGGTTPVTISTRSNN